METATEERTTLAMVRFLKPASRGSYRGEKEKKVLAVERNWRAGLAQHSRNKIVNRIMDTLQRHTPLSGQDGVTELWKIANRFEEKIFNAASDQHDYLRKISLKMLNLETRTQNAPNRDLPTSARSVRPLDLAVSQVQSRGQAVQPAHGGVLANGIQGLLEAGQVRVSPTQTVFHNQDQ